MTNTQQPSAELQQLDNGDMLATVLVYPDGLLRVRATPAQMQTLSQLLAEGLHQVAHTETPAVAKRPTRRHELLQLWRWLTAPV